MRHLLALLLLGGVSRAVGVDHAKFRTCQQTGFCRRRRSVAHHHPYVVAPNSLTVDASGAVQGKLHGGPYGVSLTLDVLAYASGVARLRVTETTPLHGPRWEPKDILEQTIETAPLRAVSAPELGTAHPVHAAVAAGEAVAYAFGDDAVLAIQLHPFQASLYLAGVKAISLNPDGKFYYEHHRKRDEAVKALAAADSDVHGGKTIVDYGEDGLAVYSDGTKQQRADDAAAATDAASSADNSKGDDLWEESFGSHRDSKPFGPSSVGMDMRFDAAAHVYGLAEHATPMDLPLPFATFHRLP